MFRLLLQELRFRRNAIIGWAIGLAFLPAIYVVVDGTGTLAGQEDDGRLELMVALPILRWQIVTVKAIALGIALLLILVLVAITTTIIFVSIESQIQTSMVATDVIWSVLYTWPLTMSFGMISLFLGTFCSTRRVAALIATVAVLISYFGSDLANQVSALEPVQPLFLYTYLDFTATLFMEGGAGQWYLNFFDRRACCLLVGPLLFPTAGSHRRRLALATR